MGLLELFILLVVVGLMYMLYQEVAWRREAKVPIRIADNSRRGEPPFNGRQRRVD